MVSWCNARLAGRSAFTTDTVQMAVLWPRYRRDRQALVWPAWVSLPQGIFTERRRAQGRLP
jgi:hypothetical protein